jgi:hypothetical protein
MRSAATEDALVRQAVGNVELEVRVHPGEHPVDISSLYRS